MEEEKKEVEEQPIKEEAVQETEAPAAVEPTSEAAPAVEGTTEAPAGGETTPSEKPKKKSPVGLILIIVLLLIAIALFFLFDPLNLFKKSESNKENGNSGETVVTEKELKSEYRMSGNSIEKFDLAFLKLENEEKDKIYSPLSIKYALEMLAEGSNGETKKQIEAVIGDYKARSYPNNSNMSFANAMFVRSSIESNVKGDYKDRLVTKYNAEIVLDSFENANTINNWISNKTFKLINNLVDKVDDKDFFLVNALAIDMKWNYLIHCASGQWDNVPCYGAKNNDKWSTYNVTYNHEKLEGEKEEYEKISYPYLDESNFASITFNGKENIKGVKVLADFNRYDAVKTIGEDIIREEVGAAYDNYVAQGGYTDGETKEEILNYYIESLGKNYGKAAQSTDFMLYDDGNVKAFAKDLQTYEGTTLQYVGIMPKNEKLTDYVDKITVADLNKVINGLKELKIENFKEGYVTVIEGDIPLFRSEYELNLKEDLQKLGITDVFDSSKADLSGMLENSDGEYIEEAKHKANIEFSNEGIKAAAATEEGGLGATKMGFNYLYEVPTIRINLTFDNPYLYLIRDKATGEVWFIGTVYNPIEKSK